MQDVTAAVIFGDEKVLITRRAVGEKHAGWWEFPGGKIEEDESPESCLQRELMEELGIEASIGERLAVSIFEYATGTIRLLAYRAKIISGELCLNVHDDYKWVNVSDLMQYKLLPADKPIAERLLEKQLEESI